MEMLFVLILAVAVGVYAAIRKTGSTNIKQRRFF